MNSLLSATPRLNPEANGLIVTPWPSVYKPSKSFPQLVTFYLDNASHRHRPRHLPRCCRRFKGCWFSHTLLSGINVPVWRRRLEYAASNAAGKWYILRPHPNMASRNRKRPSIDVVCLSKHAPATQPFIAGSRAQSFPRLTCKPFFHPKHTTNGTRRTRWNRMGL